MNRAALLPNGVFFNVDVFFKDLKAVRGSLYVPGPGVVDFTGANLY